jgi:phosphatidylserine/phosphatidylglycerophosphate/cardiolipin synthase-like enzyme
MFLITNSGEHHIVLFAQDRSLRLITPNHFALIRELLSFCDEALFVSPYLYEDFSPLFSGLDLSKVTVELVTSLPLDGLEQLKKPFSLKAFGSKVEELGGIWPSIHLDKSLHAKCYVFSKNGSPFAGIVTSANLTYSGLNINHETGLCCAISNCSKNCVKMREVILTSYT